MREQVAPRISRFAPGRGRPLQDSRFGTGRKNERGDGTVSRCRSTHRKLDDEASAAGKTPAGRCAHSATAVQSHVMRRTPSASYFMRRRDLSRRRTRLGRLWEQSLPVDPDFLFVRDRQMVTDGRAWASEFRPAANTAALPCLHGADDLFVCLQLTEVPVLSMLRLKKFDDLSIWT